MFITILIKENLHGQHTKAVVRIIVHWERRSLLKAKIYIQSKNSILIIGMCFTFSDIYSLRNALWQITKAYMKLEWSRSQILINFDEMPPIINFNSIERRWLLSLNQRWPQKIHQCACRYVWLCCHFRLDLFVDPPSCSKNDLRQSFQIKVWSSDFFR